ncbi:hypothetical protein [Aeromonas caviae]|uniref:glycosyltransferase family 2 protein n=1 Tax=Aeromonas caviae TaxID=648 RepID=UPI003015164E
MSITDMKLYKIRFIVVLYESEIKESVTINSLLKSKVFFENCELCIWNNGPHLLLSNDVVELEAKGFSVSIFQTIENISLSVIYNKFIEQMKACAYVFLDDDSYLNDNYLNDILSYFSDGKILIPIITNKGVQYSPFIRNKKIKIGITSGILIPQPVVSRMMDYYDAFFDEKFKFYGVDTSLFYRIDQLKLPSFNIKGFEHELSVLDETETLDKKKWRAKEYTISETLMLKYYYNECYSFKILRLLARFILAIKNLMLLKPNARSRILMLKTFFLKNKKVKTL